MTVDISEDAARLLVSELSDELETIKTEEDSKVRIVTRVITECLGWSTSDFRMERQNENGFSDYLLLAHNSPALVVEAKRVGVLNVETAERERVRYLKISGSSLKHIVDGIEQAASYATPNGLPLAVVTDGVCWVVFCPYVIGSNYQDKEAIVFPSLTAVLNDFSVFYDLLSKTQFCNRIYRRIFDSLHNSRLLLSQKLTPPIEQAQIKLVRKSELAFDLDRVFSNFFSRLTGDEDEDMLVECFVETRESRIADFSLEKMALSVLGNIDPTSKNVEGELSSLIQVSIDEDANAKDSGQNVFIVGPTGAGKSTFLDRFFKKTLPEQVRKKCAVLRINSLDATGREDTALVWMTEILIKSLETHIYGGAPTWDNFMALYHGEYLSRAKGVDARLYENDKEKFKLKFGEYLEQKIENDREGYLLRMLSDAVSNRGMLPIIVVDNTDEFSPKFKQESFQFTQALRRHTKHCLVIFPVTDKSAWSFSKTDLYGIYKSKSFFLPTPSPREVFRKRIDYLKRKLEDEKSAVRDRKGYFSAKGIKVSIDDLTGFARVLESVFVEHDYTSKTLGELTNYNIRRTLLLSQRVITSSVIGIEDLIKSFLKGQMVTTNFTRFMESLLRGDYEVYRQGDNHEIYPVFQVDSEVKHSPLLLVRILTLLDSLRHNSRTIEEQHIDVASIVSYFDSMECPEQATERNLILLLESGLIEPYDVSNRDISNHQRFAITHKGKAHLRLLNNSVFFYQMALTTAIRDPDVSAKIASVHQSNLAFTKKVVEIKTLFLNYLFEEDESLVSHGIKLEQYQCQAELIETLSKHSSSTATSENDLVSTLGEEYREGSVKDGVLATVDFFDASKGFGFAEVDQIGERIFFRASMLSELGVQSVSDGDGILCDIERGDRGLFIKKIHDIESHEVETVECEVVRIFHDRGYGFVNLVGTDRDAFFHVSLYPKEQRDTIDEGTKFQASIGDNGNGSFQVKKIFEVK